MENTLNIDVATLDVQHRRALEEVIGLGLTDRQRLIISIVEPPLPPDAAETLQQWASVYDGLSEEDIEAIDKIANTRANFSRNLP